MRLALDLRVPEGPPDVRAAALRGRDLWLASARASGLEVVGPADPCELQLRVTEPEAVFHPAALVRGLEALGAHDAVRPVALVEPYVAVWELEELGETPGSSERAWEPAPAVLSRRGTSSRPAPLAGFIAHSFAGRRSHPRPEVEALVPAKTERLLELGCAEGALGAALETRGIRVTGVEADEFAANVARTRLSRVLPLRIEDALPRLSGERFDVIVAADVLEHLEDPWAVLAALRSLAPTLVFSLPNGAHASVLAGALQGRWDRALEGIVAEDHRTYAGRPGFCELLTLAGWDVVTWQPVDVVTRPAGAFMPAFELSVEDLAAFQWLGVARRSDRDARRLHFEPLGAPADDIVGDVTAALRDEGTVVRRFLNPPRAVGELASGALVTGPARAALFAGATRFELTRRFASSSLSLSFRPTKECALPDVARRAIELGLPVAPQELVAEAWEVTFS